jgi:hypothetical protein
MSASIDVIVSMPTVSITEYEATDYDAVVRTITLLNTLDPQPTNIGEASVVPVAEGLMLYHRPIRNAESLSYDAVWIIQRPHERSDRERSEHEGTATLSDDLAIQAEGMFHTDGWRIGGDDTAVVLSRSMSPRHWHTDRVRV